MKRLMSIAFTVCIVGFGCTTDRSSSQPEATARATVLDCTLESSMKSYRQDQPLRLSLTITNNTARGQAYFHPSYGLLNMTGNVLSLECETVSGETARLGLPIHDGEASGDYRRLAAGASVTIDFDVAHKLSPGRYMIRGRYDGNPWGRAGLPSEPSTGSPINVTIR